MSVPISVNQLLTIAAAAIQADAGVIAFVAEQYPDSQLNVFIGEDTVNSPTNEQAPFVVLYASPNYYDRGTQADTFEPTFECDFAVQDERQTIDAGTSTFTQTGQTNIITFSDLISSALRAAFTKDSGDHYQSARASFFGVPPLWEGGISVKLTYERGMGEETL